MNTYANVILPLALGNDYTYEVPKALQDQLVIGMRVEVQFGTKKIYAGVVKHLYEAEAPKYKVKQIISVLDEAPILLPQQLQLWKWISDYYLCSEGEVMFTALPAAFKLSSETQLFLNPSFKHDYSLLNDREFLIVEALSVKEKLNFKDVQEILELKSVHYIIKSLLEKGVILVEEELLERYKPKYATYIQLVEKYQEEAELEQLFSQLKRARRQLAVVMAYIQITQTQKVTEVEKKRLLEKADAKSHHIRPLIQKGILVEVKKEISRLVDSPDIKPIDYTLSEHQQKGLDGIKQFFETKNVVLLHGITSSGKTQIYIKYMEELVAKGKQVLFLLPEIALTTQMITRLRKVFGNQIGIYHSKFSNEERIEIWQKTLQQEYKIIIGARSSLFLPFVNLGLVVVDEEHDHSFKQFDPNPRYHARDTAIYLASLYKAKVIIGSATPSLESYYNAVYAKKYGLVTLTHRYGGVEPPEIVLASIRDAEQRKAMKSHFTDVLLNHIQQALDNGEQAIVFQNRRGYSPYMVCVSCDAVPQCHQCDVSLTYHKYSNSLKCHYCGYSQKLMSHCKSCGEPDLSIKGFGTEKIEDELQLYFPKIKIGRLDLETARSKKGFERVIDAFDQKKIHILVGTQMVTKGLDFDNVSVVGILSADHLLNFPDFRASERAFQLMVQVSGRAGRRKKRGKVIIQTRDMNYSVLKYILNNDYVSFFHQELAERKQYIYPPFVRMIRLTVKHKNKEKLNQAAFVLAKYLKEGLGEKVMGPNVPLVSRVRSYYLRHILIKLEKSAKALANYKSFIKQTIKNLQSDVKHRSVIVQIDVDPY